MCEGRKAIHGRASEPTIPRFESTASIQILILFKTSKIKIRQNIITTPGL